MKIFDKYFQPYAEYCLRTTLSEEELKEALAQECPSTSDVLSWKAIKAARFAIRRFFLLAKISGVKRSGRRMPSIALATECGALFVSAHHLTHSL